MRYSLCPYFFKKKKNLSSQSQPVEGYACHSLGQLTVNLGQKLYSTMEHSRYSYLIKESSLCLCNCDKNHDQNQMKRKVFILEYRL